MAKILKYPNLLAEMKRNGETQTDVGKLLGVTQLTISKKLAGINDWTITEIETLCKHYGMSFYELFKKNE